MEQVGSTFQFEPYGEPALNRILRQRGSRNGFAYFDEGARELFRWAGGPNGLLTWNPDAAQDVRAAAERIGLIPLLTEFYPSSLSDLIAERHGTVEPDHTSGTWQRWFSKVTEGAFLIPDTGVILRRVLTTIILPRFSDPRLRLPFRLAIPRLVILELENLANRSGDKTQVKKGECFMAFHEIARLKKTGAMLAAPLGLDDLSSFRSSSGSGMADAFLREEVRKFAKRIISLPEALTRTRT